MTEEQQKRAIGIISDLASTSFPVVVNVLAGSLGITKDEAARFADAFSSATGQKFQIPYPSQAAYEFPTIKWLRSQFMP